MEEEERQAKRAYHQVPLFSPVARAEAAERIMRATEEIAVAEADLLSNDGSGPE